MAQRRGIELKPADIGRAVVYRPRPDAPGEEGVLVGFGHRTVWVRFGAVKTAMPTSRSYLSWPVTTASAPQGRPYCPAR
jgi:hypothetical protein